MKAVRYSILMLATAGLLSLASADASLLRLRKLPRVPQGLR